MLALDPSCVINRLDLGDALADLGRHAEADLCRDFAVPVRVVAGRVVEE